MDGGPAQSEFKADVTVDVFSLSGWEIRLRTDFWNAYVLGDIIDMIRYASDRDFEQLSRYDKHICEAELRNCIKSKRILIMLSDDTLIGWLRFNLFWDNIPFMNMLYLLEGYRGKGYGTRLVGFWENEMLKNKYKMILTSTQSNERAQFFYRKMGYADCGALLLPDEPLEIILSKNLGQP